MAGQISKIKRQLRSVRSTRKLTNAMALVSTAKMQKQKKAMLVNNDYAEAYYRFVLAALSAHHKGEKETNPYLMKSKVDNPLHIIISSNSGLCGSYNLDLFRYVEENIAKDEPLFVIGNYGIKWLMNNGYMVVKSFSDLDDLRPSRINSLIYDILKLYADDEISSIDIIYTQYVNSLTFVPSTYRLLPIEVGEDIVESEIILEPSRDEVLNRLIPLFVSSMIYSTFLQAKTSEQAARRSAMDGANRNADSLISRLELEYNQARQANITQEMTEIISGSNV
ncbi:MAG: ATP synthase F1 subunit gamma [Erysipelotrichaceae bacterium]|jgi:F-type H+-transporting ATPase subunit gamma|nr:ATP synthase F1 subunit gamma [Erysipelotrichaceae bacterium]